MKIHFPRRARVGAARSNVCDSNGRYRLSNPFICEFQFRVPQSSWPSSLLLHTFLFVILAAPFLVFSQEVSDREKYPESIRVILNNTKPLDYPLGNRLPLFLWPAHAGIVEDDAIQEAIIRDLDTRGIAVISTWTPGANRAKSLRDSLRVARIQQRLGLRVCVNANDCMYGIFSGTNDTAHLDDAGIPFFDNSIPGGKIGCPFRIEHRFPALRENMTFFAAQYRESGLPLDFVFGDWEIDGPLEVNRAWESSKRCAVCRKNIEQIDDFRSFQRAVRLKRSEATRTCYASPLLDVYPNALVGNYAVYPNDGFRYWYDYFESFYAAHPHRTEQKAVYRVWYDDFPLTGYTMAMPVIYPWARTFDWYDFPSTDYRWFYNMLLISSNAGKHTKSSVPVVPFIHWHTVYDPEEPNPRIQQFSEQAYTELLWHSLLRGTDTFFMWCMENQAAKEIALAHKTWSEALEYRAWLNSGEPVSFDVPSDQGPVISGLRMGKHALVRRTDFDEESPGPLPFRVGNNTLEVPRKAGIQIFRLE